MLKDNVLIVAPHPDDETLGCGGSILSHKSKKDKVHYLLITGVNINKKNQKAAANNYMKQVERMCNFYKFDTVHKLNLTNSELDQVPENYFIENISNLIRKIKPNKVYIPFSGDIHSDHRTVFDVVVASTKSFRHDYVREVLMYEVLSETNFSINPSIPVFKANLYQNITKFFKQKIKACKIFESEFKKHPFPRSLETVEALAKLRGSESGFRYAEGFMILKKIRD